MGDPTPHRARAVGQALREAVLRGALALAAVPLLLVPAAPAAAATGAVSCGYRFNAWTGGFTADLSIANNGPAINGWTVRWTFAEPTTEVVGWQARLTVRDATEVIATNLAWNATIGTGQTMSFGWSARAATTTAPTDITVNGVPC
jgi:hypothetical protein